MTKIAAITGATGFVGKHLVRALIAQGFRVKALTRSPQEKSEHIEWIAGDLENIPALTQLLTDVDVVFHLAGLIKAKTAKDFNRVNSNSVATLVNILQQSSAPRPHFILLSSLAARERDLSSYAESKRKGEEKLIEQGSDFPWTILRPPGVYGPEDMETLKIFKAVATHLAPLPGKSDNRAAWIYAPDLAQAMIAVTGNPDCFGHILDVDDGTKNGYSNQEMYRTAADILDIKPIYFTLPKNVLKTFAYINVLFSTIFRYIPMVTPEKVNELCYPDWICRGPHVMKMTEWKPKTNLKQGFRKTLNWYKENNLV
ncbi:MAG: NAD(P)-dependent oxidoreductase [Emcibacter sp.]|nr:NAD(P)-dependent oxidoreductase [Emcibacter sp.]